MIDYDTFIDILNKYIDTDYDNNSTICIYKWNLEKLFKELSNVLEIAILKEDKKINNENQVLKAKILVYEEIIKKSNFAPMLEEGNSNDK